MVQWVAVVTVVSPVTQMDVVEVKSAVRKLVDSPSTVAIGKYNRMAPIKMATKKLSGINLVEDILCNLCNMLEPLTY